MAAALALCCLAAGAAAEEPEREVDRLTAPRVRGRVAEEFAYRLHDPGDVSKLKTVGWLDSKYTISEAASLRVAVRGWYDAVFDATDRYPANVVRDQKTELMLREALLTLSHGDLDARLGRQQIVWGEAISTFVTDVVNPKDFREFVLPDFSELRIPIWALDARYRLAEGLSLEAVWTPDTMSNRLPKQGAEFQFARPHFRFRNPVVRLPDDQDEFSLERSEGGVRLSVLQRGWDVSLIFYDQADKTPVFFQRRVSQPAGPDIVVIEPRHPRLHIVGATLGKSFEPVVVRAEAALSIGKWYETTDPLDTDGVVRRGGGGGGIHANRFRVDMEMDRKNACAVPESVRFTCATGGVPGVAHTELPRASSPMAGRRAASLTWPSSSGGPMCGVTPQRCSKRAHASVGSPGGPTSQTFGGCCAPLTASATLAASSIAGAGRVPTSSTRASTGGMERRTDACESARRVITRTRAAPAAVGTST